MIAKVKVIKSLRAVLNGLRYIGDETHPDHHSKIIGPEFRQGLSPQQNVEDFSAYWKRQMEEDNERIRRGRKLSRIAIQHIIRTPDNAKLDKSEAQEFIASVCKSIGGACIAREHRDKYTGASDWHIFQFKRWPREENPLSALRVACDVAHDELNLQRKQMGMERVETVPDVRRRKLHARGIETLAEQLAGSGEPISRQNLENEIALLGHDVTRHNAKGDTISVRPMGAKKAFRYDISKLLAEVCRILTLKVPTVHIRMDMDI